MSYNITTWKLKKLENFSIPLPALYSKPRKGWSPEKPVIIDCEACLIKIACGCGQSIIGHMKDNAVHVTDIDMAGEGSGSFFIEVFESSLKQSKGLLEAVCIWEGGDSIERLIVNNGDIKREVIEL